MDLGHASSAGSRAQGSHFTRAKRARRAPIKRLAGPILAAGLLIAGGRGGAGHQVGHYPSFYPDEVRISTLDPVAAGKGLAEEFLHAYIGTPPTFSGPLPPHLKSAKSLGSLLVLTLDAASPRLAAADARCAVARSILAGLRDAQTDRFVFHPYPVTPYHADYLHHLDHIEAAFADLGGAVAATAPRVRAKGRLAETILRARWDAPGDGADVALEAVPIENLLASAEVWFDGWSGPPWIREGWYQAYRLLAPGLDATQREALNRHYLPLILGQTRSFAEHVNLERLLVGGLVGSCRQMVAGYVQREEFFDDRYPEGIENIGYDALRGLNAPVFIRTVKLKDYPWNGKLHLGVPDRAEAAWNPIAGFTDATGRLIWSAIGDPALIPFPSNASWMPNRVQSEVTRVIGQSGGLRVPADAVSPQAGSGRLQRVGDRAVASAKVTYEVVASPFEDGTPMSISDLLYPYVFVHRWGDDSAGDLHEPRLGPVLDAMRQRLVGIKYIRTDKTSHAIAEGLNLDSHTPVFDVYLRDTPGDERQVAALAPPWSTVPWHLLALMEEAVRRGHAAFSEEEARRRRVPWLDLARDTALIAKLREVIADLGRQAYRPAALADLVSEDEARTRWGALTEFLDKHGHLLVTNGPYRLKEWKSQSVVLEAVRDLTYPLGFGTFDRFVNPPRATIEEVSQENGLITVRAGAQMWLKGGRTYQLVKEPLLRTTARGVSNLLVVSRYLLIAPDGKVLKADKMHWGEDGRFDIAVPDNLPSGTYTVVLGIFLDGNTLLPSAKVVRFRVGAGPPG
jgi:hypothetical protein